MYRQVFVPVPEESFSETAFSCSCRLPSGIFPERCQSPLQIYFGQAQMILLFQVPFVRQYPHSSARGGSLSPYPHLSEVTFLEPRAEDRWSPGDLVWWHKHFPYTLGDTNSGTHQRLHCSFHGHVALVACSHLSTNRTFSRWYSYRAPLLIVETCLKPVYQDLDFMTLQSPKLDTKSLVSPHSA